MKQASMRQDKGGGGDVFFRRQSTFAIVKVGGEERKHRDAKKEGIRRSSFVMERMPTHIRMKNSQRQLGIKIDE